MGKVLSGACVIGQSGGPTAVINASAYGVVKTALESEAITGVYGAEYGIVGVLNDRLFDMSKEDEKELEYLLHTPSSVFGSCRYKIADPAKDDTDFKRILEIFKKYNIRYFFYNGGNDSMDTCDKVSRYMDSVGYECRVIGIPKTIDNDLAFTDHCPGYPSSARYIATSCAEIYKDTIVYDVGTITVVEIMGRHAGWLTGASALARLTGGGPDLIYLPEVTFDMDRFISKVKEIYAEKGNVFIAASEGIRYSDGQYVSEATVSTTDGFGHAQLGGLAAILADRIKRETGAKVRPIEFSLLQRCGAHLASKIDIEEAYNAGKIAVEVALKGETGKMISFRRKFVDKKYTCEYELIPLTSVANRERCIPLEWIDHNGHDVTQEFYDYVLPLIQGSVDIPLQNGLPRYAQLKKVLANGETK